MTSKAHATGSTLARPIRTRRDYERVSVVIERLSGQGDSDSAAELRLQALLREMDKYDAEVEATGVDVLEAYEYAGPRRRWSDDAPDND
jgi:hypothetical protein